MTKQSKKRDASPPRASRHLHPHVGPKTLTLFARVIRSWRVELDCSWSRIGELAPMTFHRDHIAAMLNHTSDKVHTLGHRLCNFAMDRLGERVEDGWNESIDERPNAGAVPRRGSDVGTSPLLAVSESGDK